jgi:hypothetical protein
MPATTATEVMANVARTLRGIVTRGMCCSSFSLVFRKPSAIAAARISCVLIPDPKAPEVLNLLCLFTADDAEVSLTSPAAFE